MLHVPGGGNGIVRHADCSMCGPEALRTPAIIHVVSTPSGRPVTINDESTPVGTTPFDLYLDLDSPPISLSTSTSEAAVVPDRDQTVRLTDESGRTP
jgi:hypothetical protein